MANLYGLLGERLVHSISPTIHSMIFDALKIQGYYHLFEVEKPLLKKAVLGLGALGAQGVNVTIPYKVSVMEFLDEISLEAKKIGAVNTISFIGNKAKGFNTDYNGFGLMLYKNNISVQGKGAVILGTGGAAMGVLQYLIDNGTKNIKAVTRNKDTAPDMKGASIISYNELCSIGGMDIIINCTPCGMYPYMDCCPVAQDLFPLFKTAIDLIYNPRETLFLKYAGRAGLKTMDGLYMLVAQAAAAQEIWNDVHIESSIIDMIYENTQITLQGTI